MSRLEAVLATDKPMLAVFSPGHRLHHGIELKDGALTPSFECPSRADTVLARVHVSVLGAVIAPAQHERSRYVEAHSERYVRFLETAWTASADTGRKHDALPFVRPVRGLHDDIAPFSIDGKLGFYGMDAGASIAAATWNAVRGSAGVALSDMDALAAQARGVFAPCRPPSHRAGRE